MLHRIRYTYTNRTAKQYLGFFGHGNTNDIWKSLQREKWRPTLGYCFCLYEEIGMAWEFPWGSHGCGYGDWNPIHSAAASLEIGALDKKTTLRTPIAKS